MAKSNSLYVPSWSSKAMAPDESVEVNNTIIQKIEDLNVYAIDAFTVEAEWLRLIGLPCSENQREELLELIRKERPRRTVSWKSPISLFVFGVPSQQTGQHDPHVSVPTPFASESTLTDVDESDFNADQILDKLESNATAPKDRITAIFFAETTAFDPSHQSRLLRCLFDFCQQERFTKDDEISTAVGSAIRKFAMNMPPSEFERYSQLFAPTETETLSCDIELELAKSVSWRLSSVVSHPGEYPTLEKCLTELASDYLTPRLILQKNYASIVLYAVISVALLNGVKTGDLVDRIAALGIDWFRELFSRRLNELIQKRESAAIEGRDDLRCLFNRVR